MDELEARVAFSSEAEQMMSETISVLFNMDDYNVILISPCVPMATAVLLYRVL